MKLQYQLSNGAWLDCGERTEEFMARCVTFGGHPNEAAVMDALEAGKTVRYHNEDWYSHCRDGEFFEAARAAMMEKRAETEGAEKRPILSCKRCKNTGHIGEYPFSTLPGSGCCDDCV